MNELEGLPAILSVHGICRNHNLSGKNLRTHICVFSKTFKHVLVCFRILNGAARCEQTIYQYVPQIMQTDVINKPEDGSREGDRHQPQL